MVGVGFPTPVIPTIKKSVQMPYQITGADDVDGNEITFPVRYLLKSVRVIINVEGADPLVQPDEVDSDTAEVYGYNLFEFTNNGDYAGGINSGGSAANYVVNPIGFYFSGTDCTDNAAWTRLTFNGYGGASYGSIVFAYVVNSFTSVASATDTYVLFNQPNVVDICQCS